MESMPVDEDARSEVKGVLERFNHLVATRNLKVLAEFAPGDDVLLIGSDEGEIAKGPQEIGAFFRRIFAHSSTFSWEWSRIDVSRVGDIAWLFADGWVIVTSPEGQVKTPYRITGVLELNGERWLWRQYHGSEPVATD
jgi:ketosteroid isomerase-like protein